MADTLKHKGKDSGRGSPSARSRRTPIWQAVMLPVAAVVIFFLLLETALALFGFKPGLQVEDPFVGFASNAPLFVPAAGTNGAQIMVTAPNKKDYFNRQSFPRNKEPGTFRIFCLGGSTTYGRPYDDGTSFSAWLRQFLPAADSSRKWEVINAGGISYASYRVAHLLEELVNYQPDLFIIYTGHNEFLEERTYRKLKEMDPLVRSAASLLARTRTWTAMSTALEKFNIQPRQENDDRVKLAAEVDTILDQSIGPERYTRDDGLRENILRHYRLSLENMVLLARSAGARVIFVTPASNLKDCSPFKSQHTDAINAMDRQRSEELLAMSTPLAWEKEWIRILSLLDMAVAIDPRFAELHYRRGRALQAMGRLAEAKEAFRLARDEDVCPLRALTPMQQIVIDVAREQGVMLVDYVDLLEQRMQNREGYAILGQEYFLDHVHPTIEGHKILALALLEAMAGQGMLQPGPGWGEAAIQAVRAKIEGGVDQETQGLALANVARVLLWAGKNEDAARLGSQALEVGGDYQEVAINATSTIATAYMRDNQPQRALQQMYGSIARAPGSAELRLKLGQILLERRFGRLQESAANLLLVTQLMPYYDWGHALFGIALAELNRPALAYPSLTEALRLNPNNSAARQRLNQISRLLAAADRNQQPPLLQVDYYPSTAPRLVVQGRRAPGGQFIRDGIEVEFHVNGRLKRFTGYEHGVRHGDEITWDQEGREISRLVYRQGTLL